MRRFNENDSFLREAAGRLSGSGVEVATKDSNWIRVVGVRNGAANVIDSDSMRLLDKKTGVRPTPETAPDPYAKPKKKYKQPYRTPPTNIDRRGFTAS